MSSSRTLVVRIGDIHRETPRAALVRLDLEGRSFRFKAGQSVNFGLAGEGEPRKPYSIASAPGQTSATGLLDLLVGLDARGRFGGHLAGMTTRSLVAIDGPAGDFVLPGRISARRILFIAGGVGIAPLRSMIGSVQSLERVPEIVLIYSARTPDEFAFIGEFRTMARRGDLRLRQTVTRAPGSAWNGRHGRVDRGLLADLIPSPASTLCFVCGPDGLVAEVPLHLRELGVPPASIHYEKF